MQHAGGQEAGDRCQRQRHQQAGVLAEQQAGARQRLRQQVFERAALALARDRRRAHQHRDERREQQAQVHQRRGRPSEGLQRESRRAVEPRGGRGEPEGAEHHRVANQPAVADRVSAVPS